jgi:hypothetical protein
MILQPYGTRDEHNPLWGSSILKRSHVTHIHASTAVCSLTRS